jgi:uncharacterized membrane protein
MSVDDGSRRRHEQSPSLWEALDSLIRYVISDWDRTLRLTLLISIPMLSVIAVLIAFFYLGSHPWRWLGSLLCAVGIYLLAKVFRALRRVFGKVSPRRR